MALINSRAQRRQAIRPGHHLILVCGNIASGKTTLCRMLSKRLGIAHIEIDNQYEQRGDDVILESTGLGSRTWNIERSFRKVFRIKCQVDREQTLVNIATRQSHRLSMREQQFYDENKQDIDKLKADVVYDYRVADYIVLLHKIRRFRQG